MPGRKAWSRGTRGSACTPRNASAACRRSSIATRGHLADHIALSVSNLDGWVAKLRAENVKFLEPPYTLGDTRAAMIEGPSKEAIELVEAK